MQLKHEQKISSPCVGVCQINAKTKLCLGCWRTLREVAHWSRYSVEEKLLVLDSLGQRQEEAGVNRGRITRRKQRKQSEL
jgi:predicted Fe-S protein YdhL (DUF1289 family)